MKKVSYIIIAVLFVCAGAFGAYYYLNRSVAGISGKEADFSLTPQNLLADFTNDEQSANARYLDKVILTEGKINSIKSDEKNNVNIVLDTGDPMSSVSCVLDKRETGKSEKLRPNDPVKIKGVCTGMLMDVIMVNCVIEDK
jgi:putative nucleic acid binding protein